jgi:hypothetical protein
MLEVFEQGLNVLVIYFVYAEEYFDKCLLKMLGNIFSSSASFIYINGTYADTDLT